MAREDTVEPIQDEGKITVEELSSGCVEVYFTPPEAELSAAGLNLDKADDYRVKILMIDGKMAAVTMFPVNMFGHSKGFLRPKYSQVRRITIADSLLWETISGRDIPESPEDVVDLLFDLPKPFIKSPVYGLGLRKRYRLIVQAVESLSACEEIYISRSKPTSVSEGGLIFYISSDDFEGIWREIERITSRVSAALMAVKIGTTHNRLAEKIGAPKKAISLGRHPLRQLITKAAQGHEILDEKDQVKVLNMVTRHTESIAQKEPKKLFKLRNNIELVNLTQFINQYDEMLKKNLKESVWQKFFDENPFILNFAFGYPVFKVKSNVFVGGRKLSGAGEKVADILAKNSLTNNMAIFEIKTPKTSLLRNTQYRGGVYTPSADFSGAINQILDQKYQLQKHLLLIKDNSRVYDIESYFIHCCLIIGIIPTEDDQVKSFELFRHNSKNVKIVTFDELLEKLKMLQKFLSSGNLDEDENAKGVEGETSDDDESGKDSES